MIIFMEENADVQTTGEVALSLVNRGCRIRVKSKNETGRFALAALGPAADSLDVALLKKMPGVGECTVDDEYYHKNYLHFQDPYGFFSWGY